MHRAVLVAAALAATLPASAAAQAAGRLELFGGYAAMRDANNDVTLPAGWIAGAAVALRQPLALVGDVGSSEKQMDAFGANLRLRTATVMGGVRASGRIGRLTESAQLLAGVAISSGTAFGVTATTHAVAVQPGVAVDLPLGGRLAFRSQIDVRFVRSGADGNEGGYQLRGSAQLAWRVK